MAVCTMDEVMRFPLSDA